jgi:hypothetical protein
VSTKRARNVMSSEKQVAVLERFFVFVEWKCTLD